jgi:hypothetical protein
VRQAVAELEAALAAPTQDPEVWSADAASCLQRLSRAFELHAEHSEGPDGLLAEIVEDSPRLANKVQQIKREHVVILEGIGALEGTATAGDHAGATQDIRDQARNLIQAIASHGQRGADLVYEAYSVDIEGGD